MSLNTLAITLYVGIAVAALAQTSPAPPPAPPVPPPPMRGHSVTVRRISRGWLGVGLGELTPERAKALKVVGESGVEVTHVDENSPAARAGVKEGDVITGIDGEKVTNGDQFAHAISETSPGNKVALEISRSGVKQTLTATLQNRPIQFVTVMPPIPMIGAPEFPDLSSVFQNGPFSVLTMESPRIGFEGETLTRQLAEFFGVKEGVLVRNVTAKTPAEKAGLKAGDIIFKVSGTPVSSSREISGLVRSGHKPATFTVMRNHKEIVLNVEISFDRPPAADREIL